jgi:RNA polymerase sigma factor for flagellar operon FliA
VAAVDSPEVLERFRETLELVDIIASQVARSIGPMADREELAALGREGLLHAARRFEPERGVPFRAYANFRVKGAILDGVRKMAQLPVSTHRRLAAVQDPAEFSEGEAAHVFNEFKGSPTQAGSAQALSNHLAGMATAVAMGLVVEASPDEMGPLAVDARPSPEEALSRAQLLTLATEAVDELCAEEAELVRRHYFGGERLDDIARDLNISKSWASRLHTRAIGRLSKRLQGAAG